MTRIANRVFAMQRFGKFRVRLSPDCHAVIDDCRKTMKKFPRSCNRVLFAAARRRFQPKQDFLRLSGLEPEIHSLGALSRRSIANAASTIEQINCNAGHLAVQAASPRNSAERRFTADEPQ
jgi:hypothetical protein